MKAPERMTDALVITDGRYEGEAVWVDFEVADDRRVERNGRRWSMAMDRPSAMRLRRRLNKALRRSREEG